jgi:hypothetical protein
MRETNSPNQSLWIVKGERSGSLTRIAATGSGIVRADEKLAALLKSKR